MPLYSFYDSKKKSYFEEFYSISDKEQFLAQNPHITQTFDKVNFTTTASGGFKNDDGWNENLDRIAEAHPTSTLANKRKRKSAKDVKTEQVLKKHRIKRKGSYSMPEL